MSLENVGMQWFTIMGNTVFGFTFNTCTIKDGREHRLHARPNNLFKELAAIQKKDS
jgi:hypothetical protein